MSTETKSDSSAVEWKTWSLIFFVYASWLLLVSNYQILPGLISIPLTTLTLTLHSSICHELIHGHPTRIQILNNLLGYPPIALIYPYTIYRETHLRHHDYQNISYPGIDPESFFCTETAWRKKTSLMRAIAYANMTLFGRLIMGPGISFIQQAKWAFGDLLHASAERKAMWISHYCLIIGIVYLMHQVFKIPAWQYCLMAYFSMSLIQLRSYFEHRPARDPKNRSVVQRSSAFMSFLYLNNNYHATHHQHPRMAWYKVAAEFNSNQDQYLEENGNFVYEGYSSWLRYLFKPIHSPVHPYFDD